MSRDRAKFNAQQQRQRHAEAAARDAFLARLPAVHRQIMNTAQGYLWHRVLLAAEDYIRALLSRQAVLTAENQRLRGEVERQRRRIEELEGEKEALKEGKKEGEGEKGGPTETELTQEEAVEIEMKDGE